MCGRIGSLPKPLRTPEIQGEHQASDTGVDVHDGAARVVDGNDLGDLVGAASTVPKILAERPAGLPLRNPPPQTMCANGKYENVTQIGRKTHQVENFARSAIAPLAVIA